MAVPFKYSLMAAGVSLVGSTLMKIGCSFGRPGVLSVEGWYREQENFTCTGPVAEAQHVQYYM